MWQVFNNTPWIVPPEPYNLKKIYYELGQTINITKNTVIKLPGDENKLFFIKKGQCFAHVNTASDNILTIGVLLAGRVVGDITVLTEEKVNMTIISKSNTQILVVSPNDFKKRIFSSPALSIELARSTLAKRNCHMEGVIANLTLPLEERLRLFLYSCSTYHKTSSSNEFIELPIKLSNEDLAAITFSTRVSVSRIISKWIKDGLLIKSGNQHKSVHINLFKNM